jgi:hypothetical protein
MPSMLPSQVMSYALAEAERRKRREAAQEAARGELDRIKAQLRDAPEQVRMELERMLADPEFRRALSDPAAKK